MPNNKWEFVFPTEPVKDYGIYFNPAARPEDPSYVKGHELVTRTPPKIVAPPAKMLSRASPLTNDKLRRQVTELEFSTAPAGQGRQAVTRRQAEWRELVASYPEYFRRLRQFFRLDCEPGWLERELEADRQLLIKWGYDLGPAVRP